MPLNDVFYRERWMLARDIRCGQSLGDGKLK